MILEVSVFSDKTCEVADRELFAILDGPIVLDADCYELHCLSILWQNFFDLGCRSIPAGKTSEHDLRPAVTWGTCTVAAQC